MSLNGVYHQQKHDFQTINWQNTSGDSLSEKIPTFLTYDRSQQEQYDI